MKMNRFKIVKTSVAALAAAAFLCAGFQSANAAVLANYNFNSSNGNSSDTDPDSTASAFTATGLTTSYLDPNFVAGDTIAVRATTASMASTISTDYYSFTITPTAGNRLSLSGTAALTFQYARNTGFGGAEFSWAVRSSLDGFTANIATGATTGSGTWFNASVNLGAGFDFEDGTAVTFRIYVADGTANSATAYGYLDNVVLNGTVSVIPEPVNVALGVFGLCAVGFAAGRRYLRKRA